MTKFIDGVMALFDPEQIPEGADEGDAIQDLYELVDKYKKG